MGFYLGYFVPVGVDPNGGLWLRPDDLWEWLDFFRQCVDDTINESAPGGDQIRSANRHLNDSVAKKQRDLLLKLLMAACKRCPQSEIGLTSEESKGCCLKEKCEEDAEKIADGVYHTIRGRECRINWRIPLPKDDRKWGYYCTQWAYGFKNTIKAVNSSCFSVGTNGIFQFDVMNDASLPGREHMWVEIRSACADGKIVAYVDDSFGSGAKGCVPGDWVHTSCPNCGWAFSGPNTRESERPCVPCGEYSPGGLNVIPGT